MPLEPSELAFQSVPSELIQGHPAEGLKLRWGEGGLRQGQQPAQVPVDQAHDLDPAYH